MGETMRKQKKTPPTPSRLQLRDREGNLVFDDRIDRLKIRDDRVIELSILYYNDPEPCFIHRGAVLSRVLGEIEAACGEDWIAVDQLDAELKKHLSLYDAHEMRTVRGETPSRR